MLLRISFVLLLVILFISLPSRSQTRLSPEQQVCVERLSCPAFGPLVVQPPTAPFSSRSACESGNIAFDAQYEYRCAHIQELYAKDGRLYRWTRRKIDVDWN